jgi:hypothetical protein
MIDVKKQIITKHKNGVRVSDLGTQFGMAKSTICTILKNREIIKKANVARLSVYCCVYLFCERFNAFFDFVLRTCAESTVVKF